MQKHSLFFGTLAVAALCLVSCSHGEARMAPSGSNKTQSTVAVTASVTSNQQKRIEQRKAAASSRAMTSSVASSKAPQVITNPVPPEHVWIPILVYHHVRAQQGWAKSTWSWKMTVSPDVFETQMKWIAEHGYTTITLDDLVAIRAGTMVSPAKPIVITFDDNNLNAYDVGVPIMEKYGLSATFYQITNHLTNKNMIDTERTKDLVARGFDIQSHTQDHAVLTNLSGQRLINEFTESKRILEEVTGKQVRHIAYPGTAHNQKVRDTAKANGYVTGTLMDPRVSTEKDDLMKLPRIMMTDDSNLQKLLP